MHNSFISNNENIIELNSLIEINTDIQNKLKAETRVLNNITEKNSKVELDAEWSYFTELQNKLNLLFDSINELSIDQRELINTGLAEKHKKNVFTPIADLYKSKTNSIINNTASFDMQSAIIDDKLSNIINNISHLSNEIDSDIAIVKIKMSEKLHENNDNAIAEGRLKFLIIIGLIILSIIIFHIGSKHIIKPLKKLKNYIDELSVGNINAESTISSSDEIGYMMKALSNCTNNLKSIVNLLKEVGNAKFDNDYTLKSENDVIGKAFIEMRNNLQKANDERLKMKEQEDLQNWSTNGFAKFGEILRQQTSDNSELAYNIIKALVEYINANQGGLFIVNDEFKNNEYLEQLATYAYGRKKFKQKKVEFGEGLVGICAMETETIYMTEIPEDYIEIESYLGHANPRSLLIVPLKMDDKLFGIIELASFNEFKPNEIKFVEDLAETIASTLSTAKINAKTAELFEKSKEQSEVLLAQEEEMRQNLEELQSTQEEASRREKMLNQELQKALAELEDLKSKHNI